MADITRRDFVNGIAVGIGAVAGGRLPAATLAVPLTASDYPPLRTGLRGSHPGAFEQAHILRDGGHPGAGPIHDTSETYDLVVVGGGISGLAAAHAFRDAMPAAKILILDNHDDIGGHAKRNEFRPAGSPTLLCNGGTLGIDSPYPYSAAADGLLKQLGIDVAAMKHIESEDFYASLGLGQGIFFDKRTFGADRLVVRHGEQPWAQVLASAPLSARGKADIATIEGGGADWLPGLSSAAKKDKLSRISYRAWLADYAKAGPEALAYYQPRSQGWWGVGIDAITALDAWGMSFPGFAGLKLEKGAIPRMGFTPRGYASEVGGSYTLHFPDGNATIVRLLTRSLVPDFLPGRTAADSVLARADYAALDRPGRTVRIRLSSIVLSVKHRGDPATATGVDLTYVNGTTLKAVHAARVVMASWNMMIPYIVPDLPEAQAAAMHALVKAPLVYTSVALRDARAFDRLKIARVSAPGCFFVGYGLNEVVDVGGYATPRDPAEPTIVRMEHVPCEPGLPEFDQNRAGRAKLLATSFDEFEHHIRDEMGRALAGGGFDPGRDITAITVNRWPHGYAPEYNPLWEELLPEDRTPQAIARARFGRIAIANSDCGGGAYTDIAIDQGIRAAGELLS